MRGRRILKNFPRISLKKCSKSAHGIWPEMAFFGSQKKKNGHIYMSIFFSITFGHFWCADFGTVFWHFALCLRISLWNFRYSPKRTLFTHFSVKFQISAKTHFVYAFLWNLHFVYAFLWNLHFVYAFLRSFFFIYVVFLEKCVNKVLFLEKCVNKVFFLEKCVNKVQFRVFWQNRKRNA